MTLTQDLSGPRTPAGSASYVGVSGVVSPAQQHELHRAARTCGLLEHRRLLLGVKATHKTLMQGVENKYGAGWYPPALLLPHALSTTLDTKFDTTQAPALRVVQAYAEPALIRSEPDYLDAFVDALLTHTGRWATHVQFDMLPFETDAHRVTAPLEKVASHGLGILLQVHGPAMTSLGPVGATEALRPFAPLLTHVLFDSSHGTGQTMNPDALLPFLDAAASSAALDAVGLGVAGGLHSGTVRDLLPLLAAHPNLSWDAEGRLHPVDADGHRMLDLPATRDYLTASSSVLTAARSHAAVAAE